MSFTIGRLGLDVTVTEVEQWTQGGDGISLSGVLHAATVADAKVLRQQLSGYMGNPDEEIVPVTWSEDPTVDGYYRVSSVQVSTVTASLNAAWFTYAVSLERVAGYAAPLMENIIVGALRTNAHSITTAARSAVAVPDDVVEFYDPGAPAAGDVFVRQGDGGDLRVGLADTELVRRQTFALAAGDFYNGAATVEVGDPLRVAVGQQIPTYMTEWRISNGLLRVSYDADGFAISCFDGTSWDDPKVFSLAGSDVAFSLFDLAVGLRILRNSPEEVIVRLPISVPTALLSALSIGSARAACDLALRRGDRVVRGTFTADTNHTWGILLDTPEAATSITAGIRATSNDAEGNRYVLASPQAITKDTTNGSIRLTTGGPLFSFAVGFEVGGSGAATNDAAADLVNQYMIAGTERTVITTR